MAQPEEDLNQQLQILDVHVADVLSHLEGLLRHTHSIQRTFLKLRAEAPPPIHVFGESALPALKRHAIDMLLESRMLEEIISDLATAVHTLATVYSSDSAKR